MSRSHRSFLPLLAASALVVGGLNVAAYARDGRVVLLGRSNVAHAPTTLTDRGTAAALRLVVPGNRPALSVTTRQRVPRLDADRVDGYDAGRLGVRMYTYRLGWDDDESDLVKSFPGLAPGSYWVRYQYSAGGEGGVHLWLDTGTPAQVLPLTVPSSGTGVAEGVVDAPHGVVMQLRATDGIFDTGDRIGRISRIDFIPLTGSRTGTAQTVAP